MSLLKSRRFYFTLAAILFVVFFVVPPILGWSLRGTFQTKIQAEVGAATKVGSVWIHFLPPGATLSGVEIGDPDPKAGGKPLIVASSIKANVSFGTVFGGDLYVTGLALSGVDVNASIDAKGRSSFTEFLRKMPVSNRKIDLPIDSLTLKDVKVSTYLDGKLAQAAHTEGVPDGVTAVDYVYASSLVMPPPGQMLTREIWSDIDLRGIKLTAPSSEDASKLADGAVTNGGAVKSITLQLAQASSTEVPVKVRSMVINKPELATAYTKAGEAPALERAILALQLAMGGAEAEDAKHAGGKTPPPTGTGILISDIKVTSGRIETRSPDHSGKPAFWRLNDFSASGKNVAFGPKIKSDEGEILAEATSESSSGPGQMKLAVTKLTGGYPNWTCQTDFKLDGTAATAFYVHAKESTNTSIRNGTLAMQFAGPINQGQVKIDGSITLSKDFEVDGLMNSAAVMLERGKPIKPIGIRGPMNDIRFEVSGIVAKEITRAFQKMYPGGPFDALDSLGGVLGPSAGGLKDVSKVLKGSSDIIKKVPGLGNVFGGDSDSEPKK